MRILHYAGEWRYWGRLSPTCLEDDRHRQIAGGETATLRAAFETACLGHEVHVVTWCRPGRHRGVTFHDNPSFYDLVLDGGPWDVLVVWGEPSVLAVLSASGAIEGTLRVCAQQCNGFNSSDGAQGYVDLYVSPSETHARMLSDRYKIPREKFVAIPNAVEPSRYKLLGMAHRNPFAVYHASSPDRGLHHLLELWPEIKRAEPKAELHVYYEVKRFLTDIACAGSHPVMFDLGRRLSAAIDRVTHGYGVTFHGAVSQQAIADRACASGVMCYPCDPIIFTEGFGTSVLEAYVAGAYPVTTDADAFPEVYGDLFPLIPRAQIRERLVANVLVGIDAARRRVEAGKAGWAFDTIEEGRALQERFSWARVGEAWAMMIER
ncbi:MAG: glycosyltransferase family 4 protein, partial [Dehalococcoidia bacterium]|nr:glycosyltransferase family 4 protein [Dehalococcoidia bacterium]